MPVEFSLSGTKKACLAEKRKFEEETLCAKRKDEEEEKEEDEEEEESSSTTDDPTQEMKLLLKDLFDGVYTRLDTIASLQQQLLTATTSQSASTLIQIDDSIEESSPQSPAGGSSFEVSAAEDFDNTTFNVSRQNMAKNILKQVGRISGQASTKNALIS
ncbi:hypothetical protein AC249_AIPGENE14829 [Exaiptasia diaphana]|nr:hypothetical protein AC249_AIPGENE14829 [Exaiptasia diaphana]